MKKNLLLAILLFLSSSLFAQQIGGIYYQESKLDYSRIVSKRIGNILGAYVTAGLSSAKRHLVLEGDEAGIVINEKKPEFKIRFGIDKQTGYVFENTDNMKYLILVRINNKKGKRSIQAGTYGITNVKTGIDDKNIVALSIEIEDDNTYTVKPRKELEKGEYGFYFNNEQKEKDVEDNKTIKSVNQFEGVFDFRIK